MKSGSVRATCPAFSNPAAARKTLLSAGRCATPMALARAVDATAWQHDLFSELLLVLNSAQAHAGDLDRAHSLDRSLAHALDPDIVRARACARTVRSGTTSREEERALPCHRLGLRRQSASAAPSADGPLRHG